MTAKEAVEACEKLLREHNLGGVIVALKDDSGYYGLTLPSESLFKWNEDETKVTLNLKDATVEQVENELEVLKTLDEMLHYSNSSVTALMRLLHEAIEPDSSEASGSTPRRDKRYDN